MKHFYVVFRLFGEEETRIFRGDDIDKVTENVEKYRNKHLPTFQYTIDELNFDEETNSAYLTYFST